MIDQLLATKLYLPPVRPSRVSRPRLLQRLDEGLSQGARLILVSGPAGFGKTTLLVLFSISLLFVGGGFVPVFMGVVAGVVGIGIHAPVKPQQGVLRFLAKLWPWALILMAAWFPGSWLLGHFFDQAMLAMAGCLFLFFDIVLPVLAAFSGYAHQTE